MKSILEIEKFPRVCLTHTPTPIELLPNLTKFLNNTAVFIKRDDCTGLGLGGNKARQLEFYFGDALKKNANTILATGALQSNFVRMTAAAAAKVGLTCHIQLEDRVSHSSQAYKKSGNVFLNNLFGAVVHKCGQNIDENEADKNLDEIASDLIKEGMRPYPIHLSPTDSPLGALGYVNAAIEILNQIEELSLDIGEIVVASGSGNTHAGLLFGLRALGSLIPVTGVCVRRKREPQHERIKKICSNIANLLVLPQYVKETDINLTDWILDPGYGHLNNETVEAIGLCGKLEGIVVDPVYSGKSMAVCINKARNKKDDKAFLVIHTGGTPGIFGYTDYLNFSK